MGSFKKLSASIESIDYRSGLRDHSIDSIDRECSDSQSRYRAIADRLLEKFGEPDSWKFYAKCAYHLSEDQIWHFVELSMRPGIVNRNRYFCKIAKNAMN